MSQEFVPQFSAVTDPLMQQSAHLCRMLLEVKKGETKRCHEETTSIRATTTSSGSGSWSDMVTGPTNPFIRPFNTLGLLDTLASSGLPSQNRGFNLDDGDE